jgi:hypothetical protein
MTNGSGQVISWASAGKMGFRGSKKNTPYAAQMAAQDCAKTAFDLGLRKVKVYVKGPGSGRESAIRTISSVGIEVTEIVDVLLHYLIMDAVHQREEEFNSKNDKSLNKWRDIEDQKQKLQENSGNQFSDQILLSKKRTILQDSMVLIRGEEKHLNMDFSLRKNKKQSIPMVYLKSNSVICLKKLQEVKELPVRYFYNYWNQGLTMLFTDWGFLQQVPEHANLLVINILP